MCHISAHVNQTFAIRYEGRTSGPLVWRFIDSELGMIANVEVVIALGPDKNHLRR